jgi:DNA-binding HxlR family transcriptional regulator
MTQGYGQFCPVAKASEILAERWTPLVLRELLSGSHRFNDVQRGVPRMSRSLLAKRLRELERAGVVERRPAAGGRRSHEYFLTPAGEELRPVIEGLGVWGQRWVMSDVEEEDLDPSLLMWDMSRHLRHDELPERRVVVRFDLLDVEGAYRRWWIVAKDKGGDVCLTDPGFEVDLTVRVRQRDLTRFWLGQLRWRELLACEGFELDGPAWLQRSLPRWLERSDFADVERPPRPAAVVGK